MGENRRLLPETFRLQYELAVQNSGNLPHLQAELLELGRFDSGISQTLSQILRQDNYIMTSIVIVQEPTVFEDTILVDVSGDSHAVPISTTALRSSPGSKALGTGAIVGIIAAGVFCLVLVAFGCYHYSK